ncbi:MAG: FAD-dependent oxidoreductase [Hungatella sp.]|nr:FAD-dependent oxidoreductase [Hungatella sp.]
MERRYRYEVAVIGGGVAGTAAAIGAARTGAKTLLIERNPYLGGIGTHSGVSSFCGFFSNEARPVPIVGGVGQQVLEALRAQGEDVEPETSASGRLIINYDIEALKYVLDRLVLSHGVKLLLEARCVKAESRKDTIRELVCTDDEGLFFVEAASYVDATGDGAVAHLAGHPTEYGDESGSVQMATLEMRLGGVPRDLKASEKDVEEALWKARKAGYGPMTKMRAPVWVSKKGDSVFLTLPNHALHALDCESLTRAACETRELARVYARALKDFMPGMENSFLLSTGPRIGIRESRRVVCETLLTFRQALAGETFGEESIGRAGWLMEMHDRLETVSTNYDLGEAPYYGIPLGCLRAKERNNLWCAGRNIYVDHLTLASVRVMGTGFVTGQAAGVAAALGKGAAAYDTAAVRGELTRQGAIV